MRDGIGVTEARRHVAQAERHIDRVKGILESLIGQNQQLQIELAERLLINLETSLRLAQDHLDREEWKAGIGRPTPTMLFGTWDKG